MLANYTILLGHPRMPTLYGPALCVTAQRRKEPALSPSFEAATPVEWGCVTGRPVPRMHRRTYDRLRRQDELLEQDLRQNSRFVTRETDYSVLVPR